MKPAASQTPKEFHSPDWRAPRRFLLHSPCKAPGHGLGQGFQSDIITSATLAALSDHVQGRHGFRRTDTDKALNHRPVSRRNGACSAGIRSVTDRPVWQQAYCEYATLYVSIITLWYYTEEARCYGGQFWRYGPVVRGSEGGPARFCEKKRNELWHDHSSDSFSSFGSEPISSLCQ